MRDVHAKIHGVWTFKEAVAKKQKNGYERNFKKEHYLDFFLSRGPRMSKHLKMCMLLPHMSIFHAINFQNYLKFLLFFLNLLFIECR